jgi:hypothetical protein
LRAGSGPARPDASPSCFRAVLGLRFRRWARFDPARKKFVLARHELFKPEARWARAGSARPGPAQLAGLKRGTGWFLAFRCLERVSWVEAVTWRRWTWRGVTDQWARRRGERAWAQRSWRLVAPVPTRSASWAGGARQGARWARPRSMGRPWEGRSGRLERPLFLP